MRAMTNLVVIIVSVVVLLNALVVQSNRQCPSRCLCISQKNAVPASYCDGISLRSVPQNIAENTEMLSLSSNMFHRITDKDFEKLVHLKRLSLRKNAIQHISSGAFVHLEKLKSLNLGKNILKSIPTKVFKHLVSLEELYLNDNQLESLPKDLFTALPNLKRLYLQNNNLREEESAALSNLPNLEYLDMSNNNLKTIRGRMFDNLPKLKSVKLCENQIETIESGSFDSLPHLTEVMLNNNSIFTLDKSVFANKSSLSKVTLYGNPLRCDCDLYWVYNALISSPEVFQEKEKMTCHSPSKLVGKPLVELFEENFGCDFSVWGSWEDWSKCDKPCGGGVRSRTRSCISGSSTKHNCGGPTEENEACNKDECTTGGLLTAWSTWSPCPADWKSASRTRTRTCINPLTGIIGNAICVGDLLQKETCHGKPINGGWSEWSGWSECDKKCKLGRTSRTRTCTSPVPQFNGALCDGLNIESEMKICIQALCLPQTRWSGWGEWNDCTTTCGDGVKTRRRYCLNEFNKTIDIYNICPGKSKQSIPCQNKPCVRNGVWSSWLQWSGCDRTSCKKSRIRTCDVISRMNKKPSHCEGESVEEVYCDRSVCVIHAVWSTWSKWSSCTKSCGAGVRTRSRECPGQRHHPNVICGGKRYDTETCNAHACVPHHWSEWGAWSRCPKHASKKQVRKRECIGEGPKQCQGRPKERRECQIHEVAIGDGKMITMKDKKCRPRGQIANGREKITRTENGLHAEYICNEYYRLKGGASQASCVEGQGWSNNFVPYCVPNCGKPVYKSYSFWYSRARLYGGDVTVPHSWPWQVILEVKTKLEGWKLRCGGSLIDDRWIVTAAHCLYDKPPHRKLFGVNEVKVYLGVHNLTERKRSNKVQMSYAKSIVAHPEFHHKLFDNDIGLIELKTPVKLTDKVLPVCLPTRKQKHLSDAGQMGTVVGWGGTRDQRASILLKELRLPVIRYEECVKAYSKNYKLTSSMFCASKNTHEDTCRGDSGGGYLFKDPRKKKWTLQGIVSWGGRECGKKDQPSVYTKVSRFTNWIRKVMRERNLWEARKRSME